jgi:hypothetical protein
VIEDEVDRDVPDASSCSLEDADEEEMVER